ncbi:hypothetical protein [Streptomyces sp. NPDC092370]|uniref:hypothetical protein n=1 Tax=Streptomyces sp. NPDC092370 TaxID=3366016 RepID=UPI0038119FDD
MTRFCGVTAAETAAALGYPAGLTRRAGTCAAAVLLHARGWTTTDTPPAVQHPDDDECVAALVPDGPDAPASALVWSERHGWRTAPSRRHPLGRGAAWPPPGPGVRHLATGTTPDPADLVNALESSG